MTRLAVFFDGTWNTPEDRTNVHRLYEILDGGDPGAQRALYVPGVGTESGGLFSSLRAWAGGAFGEGLSANIRRGYAWLALHYRDGDEIFLFGFSRGAYSARSLGGLIRASGLVRRSYEPLVARAYENYRRTRAPDAPQALAFRDEFSREVDIAFLGVWDTVGSIGIPIDGIDFPGFKESYRFHSTLLSRRVLAAYQALALHEFRSPYTPALWTESDEPEKRRSAGLPVEQRWFVGAHSNVGGGYADDRLCNIPCRWIQRMAQRHGLRFSRDWPALPADLSGTLHDSYSEFTREHAGLRHVVKRQPRPIGAPGTLCETLDASAIETAADFLDAYPELRAAVARLPVGKD